MRPYGRVGKKNVCEGKCCYGNRGKLNVKGRERLEGKKDVDEELQEEIEFNQALNKSLSAFYNRKRVRIKL